MDACKGEASVDGVKSVLAQAGMDTAMYMGTGTGMDTAMAPPYPMAPPMMTSSNCCVISGYSASSSAALVREPVHTSLHAALWMDGWCQAHKHFMRLK